MGQMYASGLFRHGGYYNCCCKNYGKPVGNYGSFFELPAFLLYFICTFCLNSDFCNSSEKASKIMSDYISPPEKWHSVSKTFLSGGFFLSSFILLDFSRIIYVLRLTCQASATALTFLYKGADILVHLHIQTVPEAKANPFVVLSRILQVRTIRGWYALHRLFLPSPR